MLPINTSDKKFAIVDLEVTIGEETHLDVCIIPFNWVSDDGCTCQYPTFLPPQRQEHAVKRCSEATSQYSTYPAKIRAWFVTFEDARKKLKKAVDQTELESEAEVDKKSRAERKRKIFSEDEEAIQEGGRRERKYGMPSAPSLPSYEMLEELVHSRTSKASCESSRRTEKKTDKMSVRKDVLTTNAASTTQDNTNFITVHPSPQQEYDFSFLDARNITNSDSNEISSLDDICGSVPGFSQETDSENSKENNVDEIVKTVTENGEIPNRVVKQLERKSSQILKLQYEKICRLEGKIDMIATQVAEIRQLILNRSEILKTPSGFPLLPLKTYDEALIAEDMAKHNAAIKEFVVKKLCFATQGKSDRECAKKVMALLMSNHTGTFFNWRGQGDKTSFQDWTLKEAVIIAVKALRPNSDTRQIEDGIKEWLKSRKFVNNNI